MMEVFSHNIEALFEAFIFCFSVKGLKVEVEVLWGLDKFVQSIGKGFNKVLGNGGFGIEKQVEKNLFYKLVLRKFNNILGGLESVWPK